MYWLVKLTFRKALSTGEHDLTGDSWFDGIVDADTLFSALINQLVKQDSSNNTNTNVDSLISDLNSDDPPFLLSSAFPFFDFDYYLPTPFGVSKIFQSRLKSIPFLRLNDFIALQEGRFEDVERKWDENLWNISWSTLNIPRITMDRRTLMAALYEVQGNYFISGGGLYFLIKIRDNSWNDSLKTCIMMIGQEGLGADRSLGYGQADIEIIEDLIEFESWQKLLQPLSLDGKYVSLSTCCPKSAEEAAYAESYQLLTRRGWILSNSTAVQMKRRVCRMFAEGSIFRAFCRGQVADVTPAAFKSIHNIYRYGLPFYVNF